MQRSAIAAEQSPENATVKVIDNNDLLETILSFLPDRDLGRLRTSSHRVNNLANLGIHFQRCVLHPQWMQENSLSKWLMAKAENSLAESKSGSGQILGYFNDRFGEHAVDLQTEFQAIRAHLFNPPEMRWIYSDEVIEKGFYPEVTQRWIVGECNRLVDLAKEIKPIYKAILQNSKNEGPPPSLSLESYNKLFRFLCWVHFTETLWANMTLLNSITADHNPRTAGNLNERIIGLFNNQLLIENVTALAMYFINGLDPRHFSANLLIENPALFAHFSRLMGAEEIVFAVKNSGMTVHHSETFLKVVISSAEVRKCLSSHHYVEMTRSDSRDKNIRCERAFAVLSTPEVVKQLADKDLFILITNLDRSEDQLKRVLDNPNNKSLKKRLSGNVLKHLILKKFEVWLLRDKELFPRLKGVFDRDESEALRATLRYKAPDLLAKINELGFSPSPAGSIVDDPISVISSSDHPPSWLYEHPSSSIRENPPEEQKPEPKRSRQSSLEQAMKYALISAAVLLTAGTATGIATFFVPYLLPVTIALLGAALLAVSAYGLMRAFHGFFPPPHPASLSASDRVSADIDRPIAEQPRASSCK